MPNEGEKKPCTHEGCNGTMTFNREARMPGWHTGSGDDKGNISYPGNTPGWRCSENGDHFEPIQS